jgi:hypothetical protein
MQVTDAPPSYRAPTEPPRMTYVRTRADRGEQIVRAAFARLDAIALAIAAGCVGALGLWAATAMLLAKGAPPGVAVGPHLALLANYLPGYAVSWPGSFVGLLYGFVLGAIVGMLVAIVWNSAHHVYLALATANNYFGGEL